jgi:hypothetical protein
VIYVSRTTFEKILVFYYENFFSVFKLYLGVRGFLGVGYKLANLIVTYNYFAIAYFVAYL